MLAPFSGLSVAAGKQALITLEISGDPGAAFAGDCRISFAGKPEKQYRIQGKVPAKYWLPGAAVRCSLEKSNLSHRLNAQVTRGGTVELRIVSPAPMRWLSVMSTGPWGEAKGVASAARPLWQ
ncbi:hypothetical protein [Sneathiella sp.]|uniref:hypothetical protein n=1 Tax=Sneathiella sp. TaxID=1964365 RepID=UPI002612D55D|nr:hypothetical protein [Sneathiella sp.]MDF2367447.1 hypothetical protein [Sneathiella sp.]